LWPASRLRAGKRYGLFVRVQYGFHRGIDALCHNAALDMLLPDSQAGGGCRRLSVIGWIRCENAGVGSLADLRGRHCPRLADRP
jgi:hypothetical protein